MLESTLVERYPRLYHMAEDGSWPRILSYGLLSTAALLSLYGYKGSDRYKYESEWRPNKVPIGAPGLPGAVLRDQKPMPPETLAPCLTGGLSPREWYELINGKVFFWLDCEDLERFMDAKEYRNSPQLAIVLDTDRLLKQYSHKITLCGINSGSTMSEHPPSRGRETFRSISEYNSLYAKELCVESGISNILDMVMSVHRMIALRTDYSAPRDVKSLEQLWP